MCFRPPDAEIGKKCPECGADNDIFTTECVKCGADIANAGAVPGMPSMPTAPGMSVPPKMPGAPGIPKAPGAR